MIVLPFRPKRVRARAYWRALLTNRTYRDHAALISIVAIVLGLFGWSLNLGFEDIFAVILTMVGLALMVSAIQ
jgi:hypothetical protein